MASATRERTPGRAGGDLSSAALFALLWDALADVLGSAAAAILVRRAARRAVVRDPALEEVTIVRENLEYHYELPSDWKETNGTWRALRGLVAELLPLLVELTGPLVVSHLAQIPELRERGIIPPQEEEP